MLKAKLMAIFMMISCISSAALAGRDPLYFNPNDVEGIVTHRFISAGIYLKMKSGTELLVSEFFAKDAVEQEKAGLQMKLDTARRDGVMLIFGSADPTFGDRRIEISTKKISEPVPGNQFNIVQEQLKTLTDRVNKLEAAAAAASSK